MRASSWYFCKSLMRDLTDQSHANWIIAYQNMEKEWGIQALCGEGEYLCFWVGVGWVLVRSTEVLSLGGITRKNVLGNVG